MKNTLFITPIRRFDEISRLIGDGLKKGGFFEQRKTRFYLQGKNCFVGFSWSYEMLSNSVVILLEISKYYAEDKKDNTPPKLTKDEIANFADHFKKCINNNLEVAEMEINQGQISSLDPVQYLLKGEKISLSKKDSIQHPFNLNTLPKINVYYPKSFHNESIQACKMLAKNLKTFGVQSIMKAISYGQVLPNPDSSAFECLIIPSNLDDKQAWELIAKLKVRPSNIQIFDFGKNYNKYKFANLAAGILYNSGSELWRINGLGKDNSIYIGIDLGHKHAIKKSKICITFINKNGVELSNYRYIADDLPLNERQLGQWEKELVATLIKTLTKIKKENEFKNIIIHKDGRILEDHNKLYSALKQKFECVSLVEVVKSNSVFILDPEPRMGDVFDFGSFILLQTLPFTQLGSCNKPIKIKIPKADIDRKFLIDNVFKLSKVFCGDSLYTDKKLPITTHIADKFSSFQVGKTLQSFNIMKGVNPAL